MKVTNTHVENCGAPKASAEAVAAFRAWAKAQGVEMDEAAASASYVRGKCAADFEPGALREKGGAN